MPRSGLAHIAYRKKHFLSIFICISCQISLGQLTINGKVTTDKGQAVESANIVLFQKGSSYILAYSFTDKNGIFKLTWNDRFDSLFIKVSCIGFATQEKAVTAVEKNLQFELKPHATILREVKIKSSPVWQKRDTLNYNVSEFKNFQDRVIGDVIKRLPGIEVTPSGQIKYNGRPINKYYIEGLDLLEDKYGIANNNLPVEAVEKVQVLENHQPIKMLDSIAFSDRAAINIKLKNDKRSHIIKRAKVGGGMLPLLSDDELIFMNFKKRLQAIDVYKYNNIGTDNTAEIASQNFFELTDDLIGESLKSDLLSLPAPQLPFVSKDKYLFNNSHLFTINQLSKLDSNYQLRVNVDFVNDVQKQHASTTTHFYLPGDTISIKEQSRNTDRINLLQAALNLNANTSRFYLNNAFKYKAWWERGYDNLTLPGTSLDQQLKNPFFNFSNNFKLLKVSGNRIHELSSLIGNTYLPQTLEIQPGLYDELLNNDSPYNALIQNASLRNFYTHNYYSLRYKKGEISSAYKIGIKTRSKYFTSSLLTNNSGNLRSVADSFKNNVKWNCVNIYGEPQWDIEHSSFRITLTVPASLNILHYYDDIYHARVKDISVLTNPQLILEYYLNSRLSVKLNTAYNKKIGDITDIYSGYLLNTYRNFALNTTIVPETEEKNISAILLFKDPLKTIFFNTGITAAKIKCNTIYDMELYKSLEVRRSFPEKNFRNEVTYFAKLNKYFLNIRTSVSIDASYGTGKITQIQQGKKADIENKSLLLNSSVSAKLSSIAFAEYNITYSKLLSTSQFQTTGGSFNIYTQTLSLSATPDEKLIGRISMEHCYFDNKFIVNKQYYFANIGLRYKMPKVDIEISCNNIFNSKKFITASYNNTMAIVSEYEMRPVQLMAKISFSF